MNGQSSPQRMILDLVVQSHLHEYRDLSETWRHLDAKAQATATIAGIFIAGAFAFLTRQGAPTSHLLRVTLAAGIGLLGLSTLLSLLAMRIRAIFRPPIGSELSELVADLLTEEDPAVLAGRIPRLLGDQSTMWIDTNNEAHRENSSKASHIFWAQIVLALAIGIISVFTVLAVFDP